VYDGLLKLLCCRRTRVGYTLVFLYPYKLLVRVLTGRDRDWGIDKPQPENTMINYILLVSRQGTETRPAVLSRYLSTIQSENSGLQRQSQVTEMVHDDVAESQSQDRQRRDAARACEADEDV
jgi:hypothetical protein